jgi:hypothetical protein
MSIIREGDFVMGMTKEGMVHGMVEHIMVEGGTLGTPGSEYALESMPPENPAMSVRIYKEEDGNWEPTAYSIGMMYKDAEVININSHSMENESNGMDEYDNSIGKAEHMSDTMSCKCDGCMECKASGGCDMKMCKGHNNMYRSEDMSDEEMGDEMEKAKKPNYGEMIQPRRGGSTPSDPRLYARVVQAAKDKFDVYPSAVANSWVVQEYKRRGGTYKSEKELGSDNFWNGFLK